MNVETLRLLVAKGLSAEDILQIAETLDAPAARSAGAERTARWRAKKADGQRNVTGDVTCDVSGDATDVTAPSLSRPPNENNSNPPTHTHPEQKPRAREAGSKRGQRLPADWHPQPLTGDLAASVALWPPGALERELARFRDWAASATGQTALKLDWQAAWRNWLRTADEGKHRNGRNRPHHPNRADEPSILERAIAERAAERAAGIGH